MQNPEIYSTPTSGVVEFLLQARTIYSTGDAFRAQDPELMKKDRFLAISKSDMLDEELKDEIKKSLPKDLPFLFISSMINENIQQLKDELWKLLVKNPLTDHA